MMLRKRPYICVASSSTSLAWSASACSVRYLGSPVFSGCLVSYSLYLPCASCSSSLSPSSSLSVYSASFFGRCYYLTLCSLIGWSHLLCVFHYVGSDAPIRTSIVVSHSDGLAFTHFLLVLFLSVREFKCDGTLEVRQVQELESRYSSEVTLVQELGSSSNFEVQSGQELE